MKKFRSIGSEEGRAAKMVAINPVGTLSGYIGSGPFGGPQCSALEYEWATAFDTTYAIPVNSATSGLLAACMAVGVSYGDEVIVSPYTMSATAAAPKVLGAKIIFADIEPETYCIDPVDVSNLITPKTVAVIATNLFGHPASLRELRDICQSHGIWLIEDNAQAIFAKEHGVYAGTIGHIGVFSLNVHKHLQVGEGGIITTDDPGLCDKLRDAMNHGEMRGGIVGLNLRMTEVTAAMARCQLKKAPAIMKRRIEIGNLLTRCALELCPSTLFPPNERQGYEHVYYVWAAQLGAPPKGPIPTPFHLGYLTPLHRMSAFKDHATPLPVVDEVEGRMLLVEVCSIDPTDDEIFQMVKELGRAL